MTVAKLFEIGGERGRLRTDLRRGNLELKK